MKTELPQWVDGNPTGWISWAKGFFRFYRTPNDAKVEIVSWASRGIPSNGMSATKFPTRPSSWVRSFRLWRRRWWTCKNSPDVCCYGVSKPVHVTLIGHLTCRSGNLEHLSRGFTLIFVVRLRCTSLTPWRRPSPSHVCRRKRSIMKIDTQ